MSVTGSSTADAHNDGARLGLRGAGSRFQSCDDLPAPQDGVPVWDAAEISLLPQRNDDTNR